MKFEFVHTKNFFSDNINKIKVDYIKKKLNLITDFKNELSNWICMNSSLFITQSKFDFINSQNRWSWINATTSKIIGVS